MVDETEVGRVQVQFFNSHAMNVQNFNPLTLFEFGNLTLEKWLENLQMDVGFNMVCTFFELLTDGLLDFTEKISLALLYYSARWMEMVDTGFDSVAAVKEFIPRVVVKFSTKFKRNWPNFNHKKKERSEIYDLYATFNSTIGVHGDRRKRKRGFSAGQGQCADSYHFWQFIFHYLERHGFVHSQHYMQKHGFVVDKEMHWQKPDVASKWWQDHVVTQICSCFEAKP